MSNFLLGLLLGIIAGFLIAFFYLRSVWKKIRRKVSDEDAFSRETVNAIIGANNPPGDIIRINNVEEYLKTAEGEVSLGDILEDE